MNKRLHTILNERYRPDTLEGYICSDENRAKFQEFIDNQDIPHMLLAGRPGSGKSTLAKILMNNINCDALFINAVDERMRSDGYRDRAARQLVTSGVLGYLAAQRERGIV